MNKKLLLGLLLVLLLLSCLAMADGCEICGDNPVFAEDTVAVAVDDQTHTKTCIHGVDYTFNHTYSSAEKGNYKSDNNYHWLECTACGKEKPHRSSHLSACNELGKCVTCGAEYPTGSGSILHTFTDKYESDAENHWKTCTACNTIFSERHLVYCYNLTICAKCGANYSGDSISHKYNNSYEHDADQHWLVCTSCGASSQKWAHFAYCDKPSSCATCGADYSGSSIEHTYNYNSFEHDADQHWNACTSCGASSEKWPHSAYCDKPTICHVCGINYSGNNVQHRYNYNNYEHDADQHWNVCTSCGTSINTEVHRAYCSNPNVCARCGADYSGNDINHKYNSSYEHDTKQHWKICTSCGAASGKSEHYAYCDKPTVCAECGVDYSGSSIQHKYNDNYEYDSNGHWRVCSNCSAPATKENHTVFCKDPSLCRVCGCNYTNSTVQHHYNNNYESDAYYHWQLCIDCDASSYKKQHYASCKNPTVCKYCGSSYSGSVVHPRYSTNYEGFDAEYHWRICPDCGAAVYKSMHFASCQTPSVCMTCGSSYSGDDIRHRYNHDYVHDADQHWQLCADCGITIDSKWPHSASCTNPTVCSICGADYSGANLSHHFSNKYDFDSLRHRKVCDDCGSFSSYREHTAICTSKNVCTECGYTSYAGNRIQHNQSQTYSSDDNEHWYECFDCGEKMSRSLHQVYCYNPTVCVVCGAEVSSPVIQHVGSENASNYESDKNKHWLICKGCSKPISMDVHYAHCDDTPGICIECGFPNVQDITHDYLLFGYDDVCHWEECQICGAKINIEAHLATCGQPGICSHCHVEYNGNNIEHDYASAFEYDENYHWITCINCLNSITLKERHAVSCTAPNSCECGAKVFSARVYHGAYITEYNENEHWNICTSCNQEISRESHSVMCNAPGECACCDAKCPNAPVTHEWNYSEKIKSDDTYHWTACKYCGEIKDGTKNEHTAYCNKLGVCGICGKKYAGSNAMHIILSDWKYDDASHWRECLTCHANVSSDAHGYQCSNPNQNTTKCSCGYEGDIPIWHSESLESNTPATCLTDGAIIYRCSGCGKTRTEIIKAAGKHTEEIANQTPATCLVDGSITYKCSTCGESRTEVIKAAGKHTEEIVSEIPATCLVDGSITYKCSACGESRTEVIKAVGKHEEVIDSGRKATCTETGYQEGKHCSVCGEVLVERLSIPATGHRFNRYLAQDGSMHTAVCENGCGKQNTSACEYEKITAEKLTFFTCKVCGNVKLADTSASGDNSQSQLIENASISSIEGAQPTVYLQVLPADSPYAGAHLFHISLCMDDSAFTPTEAMRVEIPLDNADTMQTSDWQLFFIAENGQMTELPFEIADGKIVFTATQLGMFLFAPAGIL